MSLEQGLVHFGLTTLNYLPANESLIFSPLSIILALGVISAGLDGTSKVEFDQAFSKVTSSSLGFPFTLPKFDMVKEKCVDLYPGDNSSSYCFEDFPTPKNRVSQMSFYTLMLSDSRLKNKFISEIYKRYDADVMVLELNDIAGVLEIVNQKMAKITGGKFKLDRDILGCSIQKMVIKQLSEGKNIAAQLLNFVHFKGSWHHRFSGASERAFYLENGEHKGLPFMQVTNSFKYLKTGEFFLISIPYTDGFKFFALLPNENLSLDDCLKNMSTKILLKTMKSIESVQAARIQIKIPKFRINTNIDLKEMLGTFGISDIFTKEANFSRMTTERVFIGGGKHSAMIDLDESGIEAVGTTSFRYARLSYIAYKQVPLVVELNRPFAFFITVKNYIVFMGKMNG